MKENLKQLAIEAAKHLMKKVLDQGWLWLTPFVVGIAPLLFGNVRSWLVEEITAPRWLVAISILVPFILFLGARTLWRRFRRKPLSPLAEAIAKAHEGKTYPPMSLTREDPGIKDMIERAANPFEEGEFEGMYWRWVLNGHGEMLECRPYCVQCDYDLNLADVDYHFDEYHYLECKDCGHQARLDNFEGEFELRMHIANMIRRAARNDGIRKEIQADARARNTRLTTTPIPKLANSKQGFSREASQTALNIAMALEGHARMLSDRISHIDAALQETRRRHSYEPIEGFTFPLFNYPSTITWQTLDQRDESTLKNIEVACLSSWRHLQGVAEHTDIAPDDWVEEIALHCAKTGAFMWSSAEAVREKYDLGKAYLGEHDALMHATFAERISADEAKHANSNSAPH